MTIDERWNCNQSYLWKENRLSLIPEIKQEIIYLLFPQGIDLLALSKVIFYNISRFSTVTHDKWKQGSGVKWKYDDLWRIKEVKPKLFQWLCFKQEIVSSVTELYHNLLLIDNLRLGCPNLWLTLTTG